MKRLRVRWSTSASLDLIEIVEFTRNDRPVAAQRVGREILCAGSRLNRNPRQGRIVPEFLEQGIADYRQTIVTVYRAIYAVKTDSIEIVAVIDSRRNLQDALFRRLIR